MVHQEVGAVILGCDRVRVGLRDALQHLQALEIHFISAWRPLFGADFSGHDNGRFLSQIFDRFEQFVRQRALDGHALHQAVAVAEDRERDLSGAANVVEPAGDLDRLADVLARLGNGNSRNHRLWNGPSAGLTALRAARKSAGRYRAGWGDRCGLSAPAAADTGPPGCPTAPWRSGE